MKFSLLTLCRENPIFLARFFDSIIETADDLSEIEVVLRMDSNDPTLDVCKEKITKISPKLNVYLIVGEEPVGKSENDEREFWSLGDMWNECWKESHGDILQLCGDDLVYETPGWDTIIYNKIMEYPDRIILVQANDMKAKHQAATHPFLHRKWTDIIGYFTPPQQVYGNDSWLEQIARNIGRYVFLEDVIISHKKFGADDERINNLIEIQHFKETKGLLHYNERNDERLRDEKILRKYIYNNGIC